MKHLVLSAKDGDTKVHIRITDLTAFVQAPGDQLILAEDEEGRAISVVKGTLTDIQVEECYTLTR